MRYWVHNNMITINGQKMGKSLGNFITLPELFSGNHPKLEQAYSPMTVRFFILQAHYRGTLDFSNEALQAAEKALRRVMQAYKDLVSLRPVAEPVEAQGPVDEPGQTTCSTGNLPYGTLSDAVAPDTCPADSEEVKAIFNGVYDALCDDLNTPVALSHVFEAVRLINSAKAGDGRSKPAMTEGDLKTLLQIFNDIVFGVLGLKDETAAESGKGQDVVSGLMDMVLEERAKAKAAKDWATSDAIRDHLKALGITVKDTKDGAEWTIE